MIIREPIVAGRFYPSDSDRCAGDLRRLLNKAKGAGSNAKRVYGGVVPHAGWMCSGAVAARVFASAAEGQSPSTLVLFGGVHRYRGREAAVFGSGRWETPLGSINIDSRLAERILGHTNLIVDDPYAHEEEHSLEVQVPFIKHLFPDASIVPIMVPSLASADEVGQAVARTILAYKYDALIIGSTDLTHYGPGYGFIPKGIGAEGIRWARDVNDRRFVELVCGLHAESVVAEALEHKNACSSGAAAATIAAVKALGANHGVLLDQTCSSDVLSEDPDDPMSDSVGYAAIVFV